jgi:Fe-S-cluster containining protein
VDQLFPQLRQFYEDFALKVREMNLEEADCGDCGRCCESPPFLMTTSDLEYHHIQQFIKESGLPYRVHFRVITDEEPDRREAYLNWTCPFYTRYRGCTIYPVRPFACRIFGPLAQEPIDFEGCAFKNPQIYSIPPEIPLWDRYAGILRQYDFKRGYIFPDQTLFTAPGLQLLMGFPIPWSQWKALAL